MTARWRHGISVTLAMLAGFVDAQGYLALGGLFMAFMSGNSTIAGTSAVTGPHHGLMACGLVAMFVMGVIVGTWVGKPFGGRRPPVIMLLISMILAAAAMLQHFGQIVPCCLVVALAMGAENTVFETAGKGGIGLTYMTGALVRIGQATAEALTGSTWADVLPDLLLWAGMVAGASLGAAAYQRIGLNGLWVAVSAALIMAAIAKVRLRSMLGNGRQR